MTPKGGAAWLPSALLLLLVPGSLSLRGPSTVTGTVGGSLSLQCRYEKEYTENKKYWCKSSRSLLWREKIVETTESEREERSGHVSIRDHPANLTFTVTLERVTEDDEGTYWCGIDASWLQGVLRDPVFQVVVSVFPAVLSPKIFTSTPGPPMTLPAPSWSSTTRQETLDPSQHHWSLLSSVHFLLLVFLEVPLLLSMLSAVLWVNRPQRSSGGRRSQPNCEHQ
ncbi:PREDICTED: LOW QUALITY PROTEIN: CMRF35-like molecule 6 [Ceratotherium simum simum]|uniref:LOW QUALITY PROTEIN: CMRF35-like molecule 6 n=1 Tax=Ceratotherium simum simum TaxID=73337 RepID=A0ABM1CYS5_CERSS|nr:PREDICTED: LOW QUALITY PROTEIN: CMRF35-like molecule 6 [Ceratotherium simum simum]